MEISGPGKSPNTSVSFRYNANNEELEELYDVYDDPPTPQFDASPNVRSETASPKKGDKPPSILDKYFKSMRAEKPEKVEDGKTVEPKASEEGRSPPKEVTLSPVKEYLNRLSKKSVSDTTTLPEPKEPNETWKIFSDFKFKITQAVEDIKTRSLDDTKEKSVPRDSSISDSEDNSVVKDLDISVGDTDNQVSSLESSMQNLSEMTQPVTAKANDKDSAQSNKHSESSDDTHKNYVSMYVYDVSHNQNESAVEVESGVEALEDGFDSGCCESTDGKGKDADKTMNYAQRPFTPSNFNLPPNKNNLPIGEPNPNIYLFTLTMYFLTFILIAHYFLFPNSNIWNGFLLGVWFFCLMSNLRDWFMDRYFGDWEPHKKIGVQPNRSVVLPSYTIPSVKEHKPLKKFESWINHYRFPDYDPFNYHVNKTTTAFMKLEGCNLRISYTKSKIGKRALWNENIIDKVMFYQHRLYNLTGARVILLPKGLVRRRQWSKKYPICIILSDQEKIQVLEKEGISKEKKPEDKKKEELHEMESTETNTSPEKKRKFVWRRREKSIHTEAEAGKEGLRHRLVRKMHRDKKTDSVSTCTEPPATDLDDAFHDAEMELSTTQRPSVCSTRDELEEDLDDTELSKIKDFLEEAEQEVEGTADGEWSLHVKTSRDKHSRLYLFGRTGREKHEWFRRLSIAIEEADSTQENSAAEEKTQSEAQSETKDGVEMAVYKVTERETVAFAKNTALPDSSETVSQPSIPRVIPKTYECAEKTFWPFLIKIIESHETTTVQKCDVGVMCQLEPSPLIRYKSKKKRLKSTSLSTCECRMLPAEVTWLNTMLARMVYDITRDPIMITKMQNRIQKKLHTLKLPSFMSPLVVTALSLSGECPLVERVMPPQWDERGVWFDADLRYDGGAYITILTQINLMKLKEKNISLEEEILGAEEGLDGEVLRSERDIFSDRLKKHKPAIYDSEVEDSAESSDDDESPPLQPVDSNDAVSVTENSPGTEPPASSKKKFLRMVDKIATNKYFQQVTDYKYVKRAMEGLSNTDIKLQVEVHRLEGRLAINLPPPPHDRLWIGFRTNPQLVLKARPAVGARTLRFAHISNWIEQKLTKEFEKVLVLPNMEDLIVDLLIPTPIDYE